MFAAIRRAQAGGTPGAAFGTNHSEEGLAVSGMADASPPVSWRILMDRTMRWFLFVLALLLTPLWISYSFSAGSGPKVAFIPPALVLVAIVFTSLWKRLVVFIAGELEPSYHPYWGAALLARGSVRIGLVAAAVAVCAGAIVALTPQLRPDAGADNQSAARRAPQQKAQPGFTPLPQSILAAEPLGPAPQFQPPSATPAQAPSGIAQQSGVQPQSNQPPSNQARDNQAPGNQQQVAPAQQQTAPQVSATPAPYARIANDDDRPAASRRVRHPRKQATSASNAPRYRYENYVPRYGPDQYGAWSGGATQRFDARDYDRVYNSYGEPRFGPDARYLRRSRVIPYPRREQYWGGYRYGD
jgi:hypothetical protein